MRKIFIIVFMWLLCLGAAAQNISVKSFKALPMDMTASSLEGKRLDQNGNVAALIKVVTTETGFVFEGGTLGIVDTKQTPGEVWVWVPRAARKITIKHPKLGVLRDYYYPIEIEAERTYEMVLTTAKIETIVKEAVTQQYLIFELEPKSAILEVNDQLWSVDAAGTAMQYVEFGSYTYRVRAANYNTDAGVIDVNDPDNPVTVKVSLQPNLAEVTLKVDADAEIWVNNVKKGVRSWTGPLGNGTYKMECRQEGHETTSVSKEITAEMNGQTITLPAPRPIYGSLSVETTPNLALLYIDGKEIGKTPRFINEILAGQHEIRLTKDGYLDYRETVTVAKGERKQVKATMTLDGSVPVAEKPQQPKPQQPETAQPISNTFFVMANAANSIVPQASFGLTVGSVKALGWYVSLATNFNFDNSKGSFTCDGSGNWINQFVGDYEFTGGSKTSRLAATAGMAVRISDPLYAYVGAGYGYRNLYWRYIGDDGGGYAQNVDHSYQGLAVDAGLMLHFRGFGVSLGVQTIGVKYLEAKVGIGYTLKRK